jgi:hypothetical protein
MFIIGTTSLTMHCISRRRQRSLRHRVMNGEVDLERLGIKRLIVPPYILDKMPVYTFPARESTTSAPQDDLTKSKEVSTSTPSPELDPDSDAAKDEITVSPADIQPAQRRSVLEQTTCPICIDDYVPGESVVRELPCRHIFHPECVDNFLRENSSLCPLCKHSSLPSGYCPPISYAMVRRERALRRMHGSAPRLGTGSGAGRPGISFNMGDLRHRTGRLFARPGRDEEHADGPQAIPNRTTPSSAAPGGVRQDEELARERAIALLGRHPDGLVDPELEDRNRSRWRKVLGKIWPGIT